MDQMNCYKVRCEATNSQDDCINIGGDYIDAENGCVFVVARSVKEAAERLGQAKIIFIERVGVAY